MVWVVPLSSDMFRQVVEPPCFIRLYLLLCHALTVTVLVRGHPFRGNRAPVEIPDGALQQPPEHRMLSRTITIQAGLQCCSVGPDQIVHKI